MQKIEKGDSTHDCQRCGLRIGGDHNASINILGLGLEKQKTTVGLAGSHVQGDFVRPQRETEVGGLKTYSANAVRVNAGEANGLSRWRMSLYAG
jgi:transposase